MQEEKKKDDRDPGRKEEARNKDGDHLVLQPKTPTQQPVIACVLVPYPPFDSPTIPVTTCNAPSSDAYMLLVPPYRLWTDTSTDEPSNCGLPYSPGTGAAVCWS